MVSHAFHQHVIVSTSDWFIGLLVFFMISQFNNLVSFYATQLETALKCSVRHPCMSQDYGSTLVGQDQSCGKQCLEWLNPRGVLRISSDGDDRMEPKVKTQRNPWTKN